jgi:hypothetical protein
MNKIKPDRSEVIKSALCTAGCGAPWKKWHRACNLVFCDAHINDHECRPVNTRIFPGEQPKTARKRKPKSMSVPVVVQPKDLFVAPSNGNGNGKESQVH